MHNITENFRMFPFLQKQNIVKKKKKRHNWYKNLSVLNQCFIINDRTSKIYQT